MVLLTQSAGALEHRKATPGKHNDISNSVFCDRVVLSGSNLTGPRVIVGRVTDILWTMNDLRMQRMCLSQPEDDCGYGMTGHIHISAKR
jgi:hypothetical protein